MTRLAFLNICPSNIVTLALLCGAATVSAQNTPEMREILNRLDRLEKENQVLTQEVRSLRQEVATLRPVASAASAPAAVGSAEGQEPPADPAPQLVEDQVAVQRSRI